MHSVIITGVSGNLGSALAAKFFQEGYKVYGIARSSRGSDFAQSHFHFISSDLMDEQSAKQAVEEAIADAKQVDVAVLTVGGYAGGNWQETGTDLLRKMISLNVETTWNVVRPVFEHMLKNKKGRIFLTGARTGLHMEQAKFAAAYGLSKSLIFRMAELLNAEAKGTDVYVSVVAPSIIDTPENRQAMPNADFIKWESPESIAETIYHYSTAAPGQLEPVLQANNIA